MLWRASETDNNIPVYDLIRTNSFVAEDHTRLSAGRPLAWRIGIMSMLLGVDSGGLKIKDLASNLHITHVISFVQQSIVHIIYHTTHTTMWYHTCIIQATRYPPGCKETTTLYVGGKRSTFTWLYSHIRYHTFAILARGGVCAVPCAHGHTTTARAPPAFTSFFFFFLKNIKQGETILQDKK